MDQQSIKNRKVLSLVKKQLEINVKLMRFQTKIRNSKMAAGVPNPPIYLW